MFPSYTNKLTSLTNQLPIFHMDGTLALIELRITGNDLHDSYMKKNQYL